LGGADADLVIDDKLIDIKTTKKLQMNRNYFNQLIGYYTLYRIGGIAGMPPQNEIKKLVIYFSRYGYLHLYKVEDIINENRFTKFLEWFKERARQELCIFCKHFDYENRDNLGFATCKATGRDTCDNSNKCELFE